MLTSGPRMGLALAMIVTAESRISAEERTHSRPESHERHQAIEHVLLISVDGLHAVDVERFIRIHPKSTLAQLSANGLTYSQTSVSKPSDSFPALLSMVTGGSPAVTGVYYDDVYDRQLLPPLIDADGNPWGGTTLGTEVAYDETVDFDSTRSDAGGGINPQRLPRDPKRPDGHGGFEPVYPHQFLRVNTLFEIVKKAHLRTAWCDKHPSYDILNGPSGTGVDDLFTPEINAFTPESLGGAPIVNTASALATANYDDTKVAAILNQIDGWDSRHTHRVGVPAVFGLNFQAVSVAQKLASNLNPDGSTPSNPSRIRGGYQIDDATGLPVPTPILEEALAHTDASLAQIVDALSGHHLLQSTVVILTSKHGQNPMDPTRLKSGLTGYSLGGVLSDLVKPVASVAQMTLDAAGLIWLKNSSETGKAVKALQAGQPTAFIETIYAGESIQLLFGNPANDSRVPDIIVQPQVGVIYTNSKKKVAEHSGFSVDDLHVPLIVSNPQIHAATIRVPVVTAQIAPSILSVLGLNPEELQAVRVEGTQVLPGFEAK